MDEMPLMTIPGSHLSATQVAEAFAASYWGEPRKVGWMQNVEVPGYAIAVTFGVRDGTMTYRAQIKNSQTPWEIVRVPHGSQEDQ